MIESFFGTLKAEYFHLATIEGIEALEEGVNDYIDYYNNGRIKLGLRGLSPVQYRLASSA
ncbi:MAG: IS3 family transposase [Kineosporiaceae bacterium]|nr:IS3 family transposase [Aeromicrobium sp.]